MNIDQLIHDLRCCGYLVPMCEEECSRSIDDKSRWRNCSDSLKTDSAAALEEQMRWRDAKTELPKGNGRYLCSCKRSITNGYYLRISGFSKSLKTVSKCDFDSVDRPGFYEYDSEYGYYEVANVTHWKPLPELPEEVQ